MEHFGFGGKVEAGLFVSDVDLLGEREVIAAALFLGLNGQQFKETEAVAGHLLVFVLHCGDHVFRVVYGHDEELVVFDGDDVMGEEGVGMVLEWLFLGRMFAFLYGEAGKVGLFMGRGLL